MIKFIIFNVKRFLLVGVLFLVTFLLNLTAFGEDCTLSVNAGIDKVICKGSEAQLDVTVTGGGSGVSYSWSPGTGLTDPAIPNPKAHPDVTTTYTVTIKEGSCTSTDVITVTVNPLPMVDFTFLNNQCSGSAVAFTPSVSGTGPFTYSWNFGDLSYSMEQNPSHEFTSLGCETKLFSVTLTVTDANSCSSSVTHNITIKQKPDINFYDVNKPFNPFSNCGDASAINPSFSITVGNSSVSTCISSYSINWGDGNTASGITFPLSHTYSQLGAYNMVITAMGTNGCSNSKTYVIKNVSNPSGGITSPGSTVNLCAPTSDLQFAISDWATNSPGTTYQLNYGDDSPVVTLTQEQMVSNSLYYNASNPSASLNYPVPHSYTSSNCPKLFYTINLTVTNACGETKGTISNISVLVKPAANFTAPTTGCTNSSILFNNTTIAGYGQNCSLVYTKKWNFGDGTADVIQTNSEQSANHTYLNAGTYTVRLTTENFCGSSTITKTICIESPLTPAFSLNENTGCIPLAITATNATNISNNCAPPVYNWDVSYSAGNCGTSSNYTFTNGTGQTSANPSFLFTNPGTYTIRLSVTNSCGTFNTTKTVTVKKPPVVSISGIPAKICQTYPETQINPVANVTNCGSQTLTYEWSFPGGSPAASSNANPGTVSYSTSGTYSVTLMVINECVSTSYNTSFTINPGPTVNDITSQVKCKGEQSDAITFGGTVPNTVYNWTNNNAGIGLALSGSGNIDPFISVNNGATIQTATITVTPVITATSCTGTPKTFTITVHPQATVNPVSNISLCNNAAQGAINFSGNVTGTTFSWVNNNPDIGLAASGTGNIPSFTAVNTGTMPLTATISVTPFNTRNCAGPVRTFTITVNPTPGTMALADKEFCNGVLTSAITFSNAVAGTGYSWASSNPSIGLPSSGTGNILPFTPANLSSSLVTSTITVTPAANGCSGTAQTFTISVNPNLTVTNSPLTQTICSEGTSTQVDLTSNISGATFTWTASSTAGTTGFTPSGTSFIPPQTLVNSTSSNGTVTYTIIPVADGCAGSPVNYTIIVRPRPNVSNNPKNKTICSGSSTNMILTSNVTGTTYDWTASVTEGNITGFSPTGSGNINDLLSNSGTTPGTVRYVITPTANGCSGLPVFYDVSVQPVAHITNDLTSQIICSGTASTALNLTSDVTGVTFNWAVNATSGITGFTPAGNGNSIPSAAINSTLASKGTITYTITPSINGCAGVASAYLIEVNPAATVTNPLAQTICSGSSTSAVTLTSNVPGTSFTWNVTPPPSSNITGYTPGGSDMIGSQLITNSGTVPENIIYHIIPSSNLGISCPGVPADYIVTVNPLPVVLATPLSQEICSGNLMNINLSSPVNNVTFTWTVESVTGPVTGAQSGSGSLISQILINPSSEKGSVRYKITPHFGSCSGEAIFADVTVKPHPSPTITGDNSACIGSSGNLYRTEPGRSNYIWTVSPGGVITQGQGTNELSVRWDNTGHKTISVNYENAYGCTAITPTLINVTVNPILPVSVTISGRNNICPGTTVTFTATPVNGGLNPAYQWG